MTETPPPWQTSNQVHELNITGYLFPWRNEQPVFVTVGGTNDLFLPLFATADKLEEMMNATEVPYDSIKQIEDGVEFLDSIPTDLESGARIRIMIDPYLMTNGNTRFREIFR